MADFAVSTAAKMLTRWLVEEAVLLRGVTGEVQKLRDTLLWMQSFLKDADVTQMRSERFQTWMSQIKEVAFDAEVLIETYYLSKEATKSWWKKPLKPIHLHKIQTKINKITSRLVNISKQKEDFGFATTLSTPNKEEVERLQRLRDWRQRSPGVQDEDLVDLAEDTRVLLTQLSTTTSQRCVVAIVGLGGLGKTTLAKKIYNHPQLLGNRFDCRSFVYVSQEFNKREILQKIIIEVGCPHDKGTIEKLKEETMVDMLRSFLNDKRYLVVLDDIWKKGVWDGLTDAFPSGRMGSKVMITTRFRDIAVYADPRSKPHEPRMLTDEESLTLLLRKALPGTNDIPLNMRKVAREMAIKCGGLPLAVVVLGGLLRSKAETIAEWGRVLHNISWHLISGQSELYEILALSYFDLPFHLKSCFLHLGIFPEDTSIKKHDLIRLWVAEGFLPEQGNEIEEGVAEDCLKELVSRCMIQVETLTSLGNIKTVRIHDVLREFSISTGKEENFLRIIYTEQESEILATHQTTESQTRLAIHAPYKGRPFIKSFTRLRTLHFFGKVHGKIDFSCKKFKLLRILDINFHPGYPTRDTHVGVLRRLRVLRLEGPGNFSGLSLLRNLQTLDMRSYGHHDPPGDFKMENLRHFLLCKTIVHYPLDCMIHLQTLKGACGGGWVEDDDGLAKMINLRRLAIRSITIDHVTKVFSIVKTFLHLQSLSLDNQYEGQPFPSFEELCQCCHLLKLSLFGEIERLPDANRFPPNLVKLVLMKAKLQNDAIVTLEKLPNLQMLSLGHECYPFTELVCSSEGFPELQVLQLIHESSVEVWKVEEGALKKLKKLIISRCYNLKQVSEGFKSLTTLREIGIQESPEFVHMVQTEKDVIEFTRKNSIKVHHVSIRDPLY